MLPWRRRKFVLVEEETKTNPKSMGVGGTYGSIIWSLIHSCHDVLPNCPFERLGRIFRTKRQKVELNKEDPIYTVCYLGSAVTLNGKGEGCTEEVVGKIWSRSDYGGQGTKMKLIIGPQGIQLGPCGKNKPSHLFYLHRITCCMADARRPKIFAWVYRHQIKNKAVVLRCHAVMVAKAEKAHTMALSLSQASSSAFSEFKRLQRQSDFRHVRQQLLGEGVVPLIPMRKLLNGQCRYRPPTDMPPSACQLSSITEEDEEEEDGGSERAESESYAAHSPRKDTGETASHRSNTKYSTRPSAAG